MKIKMDLARQVENYIIEHSLCQQSDDVLVGVSGGPDSLCLLHILISLQTPLKLNLHVAHLNHQLRGEESDSDASFVADLAVGLGLDHTVEVCDVRNYQAERRCSLEEAAREARYTFFAALAEKIGASIIAVGHNADDQAETIMMHIIRGTGLVGLKGMSPSTEWNLVNRGSFKIIRPLLEVRRYDIEEYCRNRHLHPRIDSSNVSNDYLRNRIRSEIMPKLEEYNSAIVKSLMRMSRLVDEDVNHLEGEVQKVFDSVISDIDDGIEIDNDSFDSLPNALKRSILRMALGRMIGNLKNIEMVHIESIIKMVSSPVSKELTLPSDLTLYRDYSKTYICRGDNPLIYLPPVEGETPLQIPGETYLPGWKVTTEVLLGPIQKVEAGDLTEFFDLDITGGKLIVRSRREGDRFQPLGMENYKKLQDFMVDEKIPRVLRQNIPLVCAGQYIIWVVGWRIDHRSRVSESTQRILQIAFERD